MLATKEHVLCVVIRLNNPLFPLLHLTQTPLSLLQGQSIYTGLKGHRDREDEFLFWKAAVRV